MSATLKRRLARASLDVDSVWRDSWDSWAMDVMTEWREIDPQINAHFAEFQRHEREWVSRSTAGERAEFLDRGASLCVSRGLPGELWVWFWQDVYGPVLEEDLSHWPRMIPQPPKLEVAQRIEPGSWLHQFFTAVVVVR